MQSRATSALALVSLLVVATQLQAQMRSPSQPQSDGMLLGLKLQRSLIGAPPTSTPGLPVFVIANKLSGTTDVEVVAEGDVMEFLFNV